MLYKGENKHTRRNLVGKTKGKRKLGRPQDEQKNNIIQADLRDRLF